MKKLTDEQIRVTMTSAPYQTIVTADDIIYVFARAIEAEVLRINGLTAEAAEQREQGQAVALAHIETHGRTRTFGISETNWDSLPDGDYNLYTTPPTLSAGVPDGFVLVPVEPTDEMRDAGNEIILDRGKLFRAWAVMLSASPQQAAQTQEREAGT